MQGILRRLQSARALVSLKIDKQATLYNSIVIEVHGEDNEIYLDEVNSEVGHKQIKKGTVLHFDSRLDGIRIQFESKVLGVDTNGSIAMYRLGLPKKMLYRQRRRHYRASVNKEQPLGILLPVPLQSKIFGEIIDISASGFCSRLDYSDSINFQTEQAIYDAMISLPGSNSITCDIEVRSVRAYPDKGYALIGSEFIEIAPNQKQHLERIVAMLDRNQRRASSH
jgi:c-di-GMP-binding flagellar brake protein YcgR